MGIMSYDRGHKIYYNENERCWRYVDNNKLVNGKRRCKKCKRKPTKEGHDACLGRLKNIKYACCGHGVSINKYMVKRKM